MAELFLTILLLGCIHHTEHKQWLTEKLKWRELVLLFGGRRRREAVEQGALRKGFRREEEGLVVGLLLDFGEWDYAGFCLESLDEEQELVALDSTNGQH